VAFEFQQSIAASRPTSHFVLHEVLGRDAPYGAPPAMCSVGTQASDQGHCEVIHFLLIKTITSSHCDQ
jgi:hypothetical protein